MRSIEVLPKNSQKFHNCGFKHRRALFRLSVVDNTNKLCYIFDRKCGKRSAEPSPPSGNVLLCRTKIWRLKLRMICRCRVNTFLTFEIGPPSIDSRIQTRKPKSRAKTNKTTNRIISFQRQKLVLPRRTASSSFQLFPRISPVRETPSTVPLLYQNRIMQFASHCLKVDTPAL